MQDKMWNLLLNSLNEGEKPNMDKVEIAMMELENMEKIVDFALKGGFSPTVYKYFVTWQPSRMTRKGWTNKKPYSDIIEIPYKLNTKENLRKLEKEIEQRNQFCEQYKSFSTVTNFIEIKDSD